MKTIFTLVISILFCTLQSFSQISLHNDSEQIEKYNCDQENTLYVPMGFADIQVIDSADLAKIRELKIHHVDLVYTAYKESDDFDQEALNKDRIERLGKLFPEIKKDAPSFSYIEQTGATTRETAKNYFHGFAIHYGPKNDYSELKNFFKDYQISPTMKQVNNEIGAELHYESGAVLKIPANAVTFKDGSSVEGDYEIYYREFRNQSDIIFSGIPMTYTDNDTSKMFNSVGMFEIRGSKDGKELMLKKDILVDFVCSQDLDDVSFYQMSDEGSWSKEVPIEFESPEYEELSVKDINDINSDSRLAYKFGFNVEEYMGTASIVRNNVEIGLDVQSEGWEKLKGSNLSSQETCMVNLNELAFAKYIEHKEEDDSFFSEVILAIHTSTNTFLLERRHVTEFIKNVAGFSLNHMRMVPTSESLDYHFVAIPAKLLRKRLRRPTKVNDLVAAKFAVYNCDQVKRIEEPLAVRPKYFDKENGKKLSNLKLAYVVDMNLMGALSFDPKRLVYSKSGNNKIILFTEDLGIYLFDQDDFALLKNRKRPSLGMHNISYLVKNPEDLQEVLDI